MRIGELARTVGVPTSTIRYYERSGLIPQPGRSESGYRHYDVDAGERLEFIIQAKDAGLTLAQIHSILQISDRGDSPCDHVLDLLERQLRMITRRLADLELLRRRLQESLDQSAASRSADQGASFCSIVQRQAVSANR